MRRKATIEELVRLYFEEKKSLRQVAEIVHLTRPNIRNRLVAAGYKLRPGMHVGWMNQRLAPTEHPTVGHIWWLIGIYEGEGSITVTESAYGHRSPVISVGQKDPWLCDRLRALFGGNVVVSHQVAGRKTPIDFHYWRLTGARARGVAMTIYSQLSPRRQQQIRDAFAKSGVLAARAA